MVGCEESGGFVQEEIEIGMSVGLLLFVENEEERGLSLGEISNVEIGTWNERRRIADDEIGIRSCLKGEILRR